MIKAIIFDCFGVLTTEGFKVFRDKYILDADKREAANKVMDELNAGKYPYDDFVKILSELASVPEKTTKSYLDENKPNEPLFDFIRNDLKPKYKIGMLSNAGDDWIEELFEPQDIKLFDDIVLSYKFGMIKPDSAIYDLAAKRLGVTKEEVVFIDDTTDHCRGAENCGMKAVIYKDFPQMKRRLTEILAAGANH